MHHVGRISVIGAGTLGSTIAYSILLSNLAQELLLVDMSQKIVHGQVLDLIDANCTTTSVRAGTLKEAGQSSLVILTADTPPITTREEWMATSRHLLLGIASSMSPIHKDIMILVVSDPVDLYVQSLQNYFPHVHSNRIFGLGTTMATGRFEQWLKSMMQPVSDAYVIGTRELPIILWNQAKVNGIQVPNLPLLMSQRSTLDQLVTDYRTSLIRERKGCACFGISAYVTRLVKDIMSNESHVWVLSVRVPQYDCCFSWPVVVGKSGVEKLISVPLDTNEKAQIMHVVDSNLADYQKSCAA